MSFDFWYVELPVVGSVRLKKETVVDHANRELNELVDRGWEPISVQRSSQIGAVGFLMRRPKDA